MPLYLTGGQDGSVQMWEWGHQQAVCTPRPPGTFAKGTKKEKQILNNNDSNLCFFFFSFFIQNFVSHTMSVLPARK